MQISPEDKLFGYKVLLYSDSWVEVSEVMERQCKELFRLIALELDGAGSKRGSRDSIQYKEEYENTFRILRFAFGTLYHANQRRFPKVTPKLIDGVFSQLEETDVRPSMMLSGLELPSGSPIEKMKKKLSELDRPYVKKIWNFCEKTKPPLQLFSRYVIFLLAVIFVEAIQREGQAGSK